MKILILTNHLSIFSGSELVTLEVAEGFLRLGHELNIFSAYIDDPIRSYMDEKQISYGYIEECPGPENFDIIWSQHNLLPYLLTKYGVDSLKSTFIVIASLSPYEPLEIPGAITEIADMIIANSPETANRLGELGINTKKITIFYNAAPEEYDSQREISADLNRVLIISNHVPDEIIHAADILRNNCITVDHIGLPNNQKKITPSIISSYDAIISIGKSVQYSILSETPVYIYDRFGGPGWLTEDNIQNAEQFNFSGRCCRRQIAPQEIADELVNGYLGAAQCIRTLKQAYSEKYNLKNYLIKIIKHACGNAMTQQINEKIANLIYREGLSSGHAIELYRTVHYQSSEIVRQNAHINNLLRERIALSDRAAQLEADLTEHLQCTETETETLLHRSEIEEKEKKITRLEVESREAQRQLTDILNSTSWKITKPIRIMKTYLVRHLC